MYEDRNYSKVNWKDLLIKVGLAVLAIFLILWLVPKITGNGGSNLSIFEDRIFNENIQTMRSAASNYYTEDRLPGNIGDSVSMTLQQMINNKLVMSFTDKKGKTCDNANSYVQVTKTKSDEYSLKVLLSCDGQTDYIIDTIGCDGTCGSIDCKALADEIAKEVIKEVCTSGCTTNKPNNNTNTNNNTNNNNNNNNSNNNNNNNNSNNNNNNNVQKPATKYYTVKFNSNGGNTTPEQQKIKSGNKAKKPSNPTKNNCRFDGWYYNGKPFDFNTAIKQDYILGAKWTCENKVVQYYNVSFDSNGGSPTPNSQQILAGNYSVQPKAPTKSGCTFNGWYASGSTTPFNFTNTKINKNYVLTADWTCSTSGNKQTYYIYQFAPYKVVEKDETIRTIAYSTKWAYDNYKKSTGVYHVDYELQMKSIPKDATVKLTTNASVMSSYNDFDQYIKNIGSLHMTGNNNSANYYSSNPNTYMNNALTRNNMTVSVTNKPYFSNGVWRITVHARINNLNNVSTTPFNGSNIYFIPTKFTVTYKTEGTTVDMDKAYWSVNSAIPTGYKLVTTRKITA